jgi:hypothetical protein
MRVMWRECGTNTTTSIRTAQHSTHHYVHGDLDREGDLARAEALFFVSDLLAVRSHVVVHHNITYALPAVRVGEGDLARRADTSTLGDDVGEGERARRRSGGEPSSPRVARRSVGSEASPPRTVREAGASAADDSAGRAARGGTGGPLGRPVHVGERVCGCVRV